MFYAFPKRNDDSISCRDEWELLIWICIICSNFTCMDKKIEKKTDTNPLHFGTSQCPSIFDSTHHLFQSFSVNVFFDFIYRLWAKIWRKCGDFKSKKEMSEDKSTCKTKISIISLKWLLSKKHKHDIHWLTSGKK